MTTIRAQLSGVKYGRTPLPSWVLPAGCGAVAAATIAAVLSLHLLNWHTAPSAPSKPLTPAQQDAVEAQAGPTGAPLLWTVHKDKATALPTC